MRNARAGLAALTAALMLAMLAPPHTPAFADEPNPTLAERQAAQNRVTVAKRAVASLQARAEHAVEVYNGQLSKARKAAKASQAAENRATAARAVHRKAAGFADQARVQADTATALALAAANGRDQARAEANHSQYTLDTMAAGAFRGEGQLGMFSQLLLADDPIELANGHNLINRVGNYQRRIIVRLHTARDQAVRTSARASRAQDTAALAAGRASRALAAAELTRTSAEHANHAAAVAAQTTHRALDSAHRAKAHATAMVARAEKVLHRAARTAASLELAAAAARRAAANVPTTTAPNDAARTAIRWAFEEIGVPYSWGGGDESGPTRGFAQGANTVGFDCSGLTLFIYAKAGISLDHYTGSQWHQGKRISSRQDLLPGDLMFFAYDKTNASTIHHVGIYLGKGRMIEAPYTGEVVRVAPASRDDFIGATRPWA